MEMNPRGLIRDFLFALCVFQVFSVMAGQGAGGEIPGGSALPKLGQVPHYVGSADCRECHRDQHSSWHRSYHRTMTQLPSRESIKADFNNVSLTNNGVRFTLFQKTHEFWVRMARIGAPGIQATGEASAEFPIGLVTGSHHMQVFWVGDEEAQCQVGFPFTWLIPEKKWVPRNSTFIRPPHAQHRSETWNQVCARCHSTAPQPNLDRGARRWKTQVEELGISCEACHGPGEKHSHLFRERAKAGLTGPVAEPHIINPEKLSPVRASQICGNCHSMKWWESATGWPVREFPYRPGDDLEATTPIIRPKEIDRQPWLKRVLERNPELLADFFWPDGMVRVSGRDYNGLIESPCYKSGQFSCMSCHSMHDSEPASQLARHRTDQRACLQCHPKFGAEEALVAHTRHRAGSSGSQCYDCHMPHTSYGVLKAIRSHQVSSPSVTVSKATGRPNACNLCHLDKTLEWTAEHLERWYGQRKPELSGEERTVADSVRTALSGDAGQRVLWAWHLGWEPARKASGGDWMVPVLGQMLDDSYAAVRCVAERSLRRIGAQWIPKEYEFSRESPERSSALPWVLEQWEAGKSARGVAPGATLMTGSTNQVRESMDGLVRRRNERDVRLRE